MKKVLLKKRALSFAIFFFLFPAAFSFPKTIELNDGQIIVGEVLNETDEAIVISKEGGTFVYAISRTRVKKIRESTEEEVEAERARFSRQPQPKVDAEVKPEKQDNAREKIKAYRLEQYNKEVEAAKKARGKIEIRYLNGRAGVVEALINKKVKLALLVDTGASMVVISEEAALKLGIGESDRKGTIPVVLADGSITTATRITLNSIQVGSSRVNNVDAAISPSPPGAGLDGLLGKTFLDNFHVKMDKDSKYLILEKY